MCLSFPRQRASSSADTVHQKEGEQQNGDRFLPRTKKQDIEKKTKEGQHERERTREMRGDEKAFPGGTMLAKIVA